MGNIFVKSEQPLVKRPDRQILTPEYVRRLIDRHYESSININVSEITTFIQRTYSNNITDDMVDEALRIEPSYIYFPEKLHSHSLLYA